MKASPANLAGLVRLLRMSRGELTIDVEGNSMEPLFRGPARIRVACGARDRYPPGAIAVFVGARGRMVVHRIVAVGSGGKFLIAKGDNNPAIDRPVRPASVLGIALGPEGSPEWPEPSAPPVSALIRLARLHFGAAWLIASVSIALTSLMVKAGLRTTKS